MKKYLLIVLSCLSTFAFAQSKITWNGAGNNISSNTYSNQHPRMAMDRAGNPLVIWGRSSDQAVLFSRWNGTMFTTPIKLNPSWLTIATASWMGPDIASHGDTVYVVVKRTPEDPDTNRIFIFTSFNGGVSFNAPVQLAFIADSLSRFPTVTTDATGNPIVGFMKFNSAYLESRWVVTKSTDYGSTFSTDVKASGWGNSPAICDCCPGAVISSGNTCAMLYRNNNNQVRDNWTAISTNNASSFINGFDVDNNNWNLNFCPSSGPDGVIIGDTLYAVFMNGASGTNRTYLSKSSLSSGTVGSVIPLGGNISGLNQQNYVRIASDGNAVAVVWEQSVNGSAQLPILFTNNAANGFPAGYDTVDLANITNADVAMSNGNIYVMWQDDNSGTVKYRKGTYAQIATSINEVREEEFSVYPNPAGEELNIIPQHNGEFAVNIFNAMGEKIYSGQSTSNLKLQISDFAKGLYLLQLMTERGSFTKRIVVSK